MRERELTILELFLLGMVEKGGLNTVYMLRENAGLTWGGIRPSLLRLEIWGFISRSEAGKRRRREFRLTEAGKEILELGWKDLSFRAIGSELDLDTAVRAVWVALQFEAMEAVEIAFSTASKREETAAELHNQLPSSFPHAPVESFHWMRRFARIQQLRAEARAFQELGQMLQSRILEEKGAAPRKE